MVARPRHHHSHARLARLGLVAASFLAPCSAGAPKNLPAPVSVAPDQSWEGIDGKWNTFSLRIGTAYQPVNVFVSTASQQTWAVARPACVDPDTKTQVSDCYFSRGRTFDVNASSTWTPNGFYQLWIEKNLGLTGNGEYGWDTVGLGLPGEEGPTLTHATVGTILTNDFWLGHFGVNPKPTNFTNYTDPAPSYMTMLYDQKQIPSVSFGYTTGNQYHGDGVLGSLTLGGYDASRFLPNNLTWSFAPDNERDILVGVIGITASSSTKANVDLLGGKPLRPYIDSTIAELWLPVSVCKAFEDVFGLKYDNITGLYLVDDQLHNRLKADNPSVTFLLGQNTVTNETVSITLPYAAFDLSASPPYKGLSNITRYFPIRRATQPNQVTLGRTFLQEAYLTVDWERQNFSVSACDWRSNQAKNIVPILSPKYTGELNHGLSTGAIIGIGLGVGLVVLLLIGCAFVICFRRRQRREKTAQSKMESTATKSSSESEEPLNSPTKSDGGTTNVFPKAELPADFNYADNDRKDPTTLSGRLYEAENTERQVFEMEGDIPAATEAGGRQLSEKETMMVREARINGVDLRESPAGSPVVEEVTRRRAPLTGTDVAVVDRRVPHGTGSPLTPRTRDGARLEAGDTFFQAQKRRSPLDGSSLATDDMPLSPISPLDGLTDASRKRFSYES